MSANDTGNLVGKLRLANKKNEKLRAALGRCVALVERQATDDGLWFHARTAPEAYLQVHLRELHRVVEMAAKEVLP